LRSSCWTSAGVSAGIDLSFALWPQLEGNELASQAISRLNYHPVPPVDAGTPENTEDQVLDMMHQTYDYAMLAWGEALFGRRTNLNRRIASLALVILLHGLLFAVLMSVRAVRPPMEKSKLAVLLLADATPDRTEKPPGLPSPRLIVPVPVVSVDLVVEMPVSVAEEAPAAGPQQVEPVASGSDGMTGDTADSASSAAPEPMALANELAVQCPERTPPRYPGQSRRQREQGEVRLRVELDESGRVDHVAIVSSSGFPRLDEAAVSAIGSWHCRPALKDGKPVRAAALQSLVFKLQRN
jgi:periplasmic protein TonB